MTAPWIKIVVNPDDTYSAVLRGKSTFPKTTYIFDIEEIASGNDIITVMSKANEWASYAGVNALSFTVGVEPDGSQSVVAKLNWSVTR